MRDDRDMLLIAVFTSLTILLWVFFELVQTTKTSTVARPIQKAVTPLSSAIDTTIFTDLESRPTFEE